MTRRDILKKGLAVVGIGALAGTTTGVARGMTKHFSTPPFPANGVLVKNTHRNPVLINFLGANLLGIFLFDPTGTPISINYFGSTWVLDPNWSIEFTYDASDGAHRNWKWYDLGDNA